MAARSGGGAANTSRCARVGVTGVPDPVQGEAVKAWVVLEEGDGVSAEELRTFCKQTLAAYKVPRYFAFCRFTAEIDHRQRCCGVVGGATLNKWGCRFLV